MRRPMSVSCEPALTHSPLLRLLVLALTALFDGRQWSADGAHSVALPLYMDKMLSAGRTVYDKQATPTSKQGVPTSVNLSMYIEGIGSFRAQTMDFQLDVYFQQFWRDTRLAHNESTRILLRDRAFLNKIWHPDVYFANARIAQFHEVTQPNFVIWIEPDGSILYDTRVSMTVICAMQLQNYPLDSQWCELRVLSYAYDVDQLKIAWVENSPITKNPNITMSDMHIVKLVPGLCDGNYSTGLWSCVTAEFFVSREITHHILQTYVPTTLIVVISWFSFWLDVEAVPARVSLAITTANAVRNSLPEVSYMKSLDLFLAVSVLFVFGVLIEFTIVNYTQRNVAFLPVSDRRLSLFEEEEEKEGVSEEPPPPRSAHCYARQTPPRAARSSNVDATNVWRSTATSVPPDEERRRAHTAADDVDVGGACARLLWNGYDARCKASGVTRPVPQELRWAASNYNALVRYAGRFATRIFRSGRNLRNLVEGYTVASAEDGLGCGPTPAKQWPNGNYSWTNCNGQLAVTPSRHADMNNNGGEGLAPLVTADELSDQALQSSFISTLNNSSLPLDIVVVERASRARSTASSSSCASVQRPAPAAAERLATWTQPELSCGAVTAVTSSNNGNVAERLESRRRSTSTSRRHSMAAYLFRSPFDRNLDYCAGGSAASRKEHSKFSFSRASRKSTSEAKWRIAVRQILRNKREAGRIQAKKIDAWSRWAFPLTYLTFHISYWTYYLFFAN